MQMLFRGIFLCFIFLCYSQAKAHDYYFGFAEMQYNETNKTLETTLVLSAHDFEQILFKEKIIEKELEFLIGDKEFIKKLEQIVLSYFKVKSGNIQYKFELIGYEVFNTGLINIYLQAENVTLSDKLLIQFDALMNEFPEQQNKLTFIYRSHKSTAVFLPNQRTTELILENN
jgi:hypothetical protein